MSRFGIVSAASVLAAVALVAGCSTLDHLIPSFGGGGNKLPGERIPVMAPDSQLDADPQLASVAVQLPPPYRNADWTQPGGYADNVLHHLEADGPLQPVWTREAGKGSDSDSRLTAPPIVADGHIYVVDAASHVSAFDATSGQAVWDQDLTPESHSGFTFFGVFGHDDSVDPVKGFGGGLAFEDGKLFVTTGFGFVVALDARTGKPIWKKDLTVPIASAPVVNGGRVFVITQENHLYALAAVDGHVLWDHTGIEESAGILTSNSAAVAGEFVVAPYSSGELFALRVENGRIAWSDTLSRTGNLTALTTLDDIAARPVIDRGMVFAINHSGRMVAIDIRSGERIWTRNIAGIQTPWVAGDFIFLVSLDAQLVCLSRRDGRVKWLTQLPRFEDEEAKEDPIFWSGPVLVSDRLLLLSSDGHAVSVSPYTGKLMGQVDIPDGTFIPPIVAGGTVYILTNDAELVALR